MNRRSVFGLLAAPLVARFAPATGQFRVYLAGPLFTEAERGFIEYVAGKIRRLGAECFVPHEHPLPLPADPEWVFRLDYDAIKAAHAMVAWIDGPSVDDGTACEIGLFSQLVRTDPSRHRGIAAIGSDLRMALRRNTPGGGVNLFVAGAIASVGAIHRDADAAVAAVRRWME